MYAAFFGLKHEPFSIAPDPRYLFMSERHREALAHLLFGVNGGGGFVLLSGEIGAGKTTVCRCFLEQIPRRTNVAYIFNPKLTVLELLMSVCEEFGVPVPEAGNDEARATVKHYLDPLNAFLLKTHAVGQNNVLIIDEAQMLSAEVLEQLRLLTNLETSERKLLQIILIGQPELREMLERPELEQLAQRVIARFHLGALTQAETAAYIRHRLTVAGLATPMPFDAKAIARVHQISRGVPRRINLLCDRALLGAYAGGHATINRDIVDRAAVEAFGRGVSTRSAQRRRARRIRTGLSALAGVAAVGAIGLIAYAALHATGGARSPSPIAAAAPNAAASPASAAANPASAASASAAASSASAASVASGASSAASAPAAAPLFLTPADLPARFKTLTRSENEAWRELAPEWKVSLDTDSDPCASATRVQLRCFRSPGSDLAQIRQLDRPGILILHDAHDQPVYALLTGIGPNSATLRIGGVSQTITLVSLATLWRGDFATFWHSPPDYTGQAVSAGSGPIAAWLGARLASLRGEALPAPGNDPSWTTRVAAFQLAQGLKPDGRPGPATFMQLNRAIGVDEPRLAGR
jgi:general secretion pathway protein A